MAATEIDVDELIAVKDPTLTVVYADSEAEEVPTKVAMYAESDVGTNSITKDDGSEENLQRGLKSRHLQMIAIGGTIGTGLWIASGGALAKAGPAGALMAYILVGTVVWSVVLSLGEMTTYIPIAGAFNLYATRFVDPSLGFAMGWIYWFSWAITFPIELTACGLIIQYWNPDLSIAIFIVLFGVSITAFNFFPVHFYGELEFWLAFLKVITVVGFIIFSICIICGAGAQGVIGFKTWSDPGAFAPYLVEKEPLAQFLGFWAVLIQAGFSYQGTELVGVAAGEAQDPRKSIPAAVKKTFLRIIVLYVLTILFLGAQVPYTDPRLNASSNTDASASPFVIAADLAGVPALADVINAILLIVVVSAGNSNVYCGSRILVGLANDGAAPEFLKLTTKQGVPFVAVGATSAFGLLAFLNLSSMGSEAFTWLINITGVAGFITWSCINYSHISFMRALAAQGISRDSLPYKTRWQPYLAWYGLFFNVLIILTQGFYSWSPWSTVDFVAAYISLLLFLIMYIGHKIVTKSKFVIPAEADLHTGCSDQDTTDWDTVNPPSCWSNFCEKFS